MKRYVAKEIKAGYDWKDANVYNRREPLRKHRTTSQKYRREIARKAFTKWMKSIVDRAEVRRIQAERALFAAGDPIHDALKTDLLAG